MVMARFGVPYEVCLVPFLTIRITVFSYDDEHRHHHFLYKIVQDFGNWDRMSFILHFHITIKAVNEYIPVHPLYLLLALFCYRFTYESMPSSFSFCIFLIFSSFLFLSPVDNVCGRDCERKSVINLFC